MVEVRLESIAKVFGGVPAVHQVTLDIAGGELFFLLGPSGCGKTTCLRMVAGFYQPDEGSIYFGDRDVTDLAPHLRNAGMVFQNYALFPHMNVAQNVEYGLKVRGLSATERKRKVERALDIVQMPGTGKKLPNQLSGGQQQRIALARALVIEPDVLLLDEPLSNLDAKLRLEMREEIKRIHRETGVTALYVTHDQKEALSIADRVAVMRLGKIEQVGTPQEIYSHPANAFIAGFIGETNFIPCEVVDSGPEEVQLRSCWGALVSAKPHGILSARQSAVASIRPEAIRIARASAVAKPQDPSSGAVNQIPAVVKSLTYLGDQEQYLLGLAEELALRASLQNASGHSAYSIGEQVAVLFDKGDVSVFDAAAAKDQGAR